MSINRRAFLSALGAGVSMPAMSFGQGRPLAPGQVRAPAKPAAPPPPVRKATITKLFRTPDGHPNALDVTAEGFWIGEQVTDRVILVDITGKVLRAFQTECHNCSGLAVGGGYLWLSANGAAQFDRPIKIDSSSSEILQCRMDGSVVKRHAIPLGGGGATGLEFVDGTLWMVASRLRALMQVNAETFQPIVAHPFQMQRPHGLAWDNAGAPNAAAALGWNGAMWIVDGVDEPRLVKMDAKSGATLESIQLVAGEPDPHGLAMMNGKLYFCDAGIHPGWERDKSPHTGWMCRVDLI